MPVVLLYVMAFAGAAVIAMLLWRAMNTDRAQIPRGTGTSGAATPPRRPRPSGPDDDPEFLRRLDEDLRRKDDPEGPAEDA